MKNAPSALIFPETGPSVDSIAKLLIFFDVLSYYLPAEQDNTNHRDNNFFTNLCTAYAPAPLDGELSRFNRLLRDMETSRPGEFSRLFAAAKAPLAPGQVRDQDETSAGRVYSALQKDAGINISIQHKERLWQARLILKLAEILDRREAEVRQGLAQVSSLEQKLFASLEGLGEAETADLSESSGPVKVRYQKTEDILPDGSFPGTSAQLMPLRLKAWAELYLADSTNLHPLILATATPASGAILLDGYENSWRRNPQKMFSLSIPALSRAVVAGTWEQYLLARDAFRSAAQENMVHFAGLLQKRAGLVGPAPENTEELSMLAENVSAWEEKIRLHFPGTETDRRKLDFYSFPGISFAELFQRLFHLEGEAAAKKQLNPTALLAILTP